MRETNKEYILPYRQGGDEMSDNPYVGNPQTVGRKAQIRGKNGQQVMQYSFRKIASLGVGIRIAGQANEIVGTYTGRKLRQQQLQDKMDLAKMAVGVAMFGGLGVVYAASQVAYKTFNHQMGIRNQSYKAENARMRSLNDTASGSRNGGGKL